MTHEFDFEAVIKAILFKLFQKNISFVLYIDSKNLYDCLVRLEITQIKRFIIDVMNLKQLYERKKIIEIK